jgi:hypothetical protein
MMVMINYSVEIKEENYYRGQIIKLTNWLRQNRKITIGPQFETHTFQTEFSIANPMFIASNILLLHFLHDFPSLHFWI